MKKRDVQLLAEAFAAESQDLVRQGAQGSYAVCVHVCAQLLHAIAEQTEETEEEVEDAPGALTFTPRQLYVAGKTLFTLYPDEEESVQMALCLTYPFCDEERLLSPDTPLTTTLLGLGIFPNSPLTTREGWQESLLMDLDISRGH